MDTYVFIDNKINQITSKLAKESNRKVSIASDFNFDLLKYLIGKKIVGQDFSHSPIITMEN